MPWNMGDVGCPIQRCGLVRLGLPGLETMAVNAENDTGSVAQPTTLVMGWIKEEQVCANP